jgi:hypothetical protein
MANNNNVFDWMTPYLSLPARERILELQDEGLDKDLAIAVTESSLPESEFYELPPKGKKEKPWID